MDAGIEARLVGAESAAEAVVDAAETARWARENAVKKLKAHWREKIILVGAPGQAQRMRGPRKRSSSSSDILLDGARSGAADETNVSAL